MDFVKESPLVLDKTDKEKNHQIIESIFSTMDELNKAHINFEYAEYELIDFAINSETLEIMVIYKQLYGKFATWVRPAKMWGEKVEYEGNLVERFSKIKN